MKGWRTKCGLVIANFTNAAALMTGPMQMDGGSNVSRQCSRSRLIHAKRLAEKAVSTIDKLLVDIEYTVR